MMVDLRTSDNPLVGLSLGAGVQSTTLALMCVHGEIPAPDCAIFADTGAEPQAVYENLDWLKSVMPWPLYKVQWEKGLLDNIVESVKGGRFAGAPFFTENKEFNKRGGQLKRQCTWDFKIQPILRELRRLIGAKKGQRLAHKGVLVRQYIGISVDEYTRMKPSREKWIEHTWPLVDLRISRHDCKLWLKKHGYAEPPRSSCTFCPYHSDREWRYLKKNDSAGWRQAVKVDSMIRGGVRGTTQHLYLHRSMVPIEEVDLSTEEDRGQMSLFGEECEGMCGV